MGNEDECRHVYYRMSAQPQLKLKLQHVVMNPQKIGARNWKPATSTRSSFVRISPLQPRRISSTTARIRKSSRTSFPALTKSSVTVPCCRKSTTSRSSGPRACASAWNNGPSSALSISSWPVWLPSAPCPSPFPSPWLSSSAMAVPFSTVRSASDALARNIKSINSVPCASMQKIFRSPAGDGRRPTHYQSRQIHPRHPPGRTAADPQRPQRRHEPRRASPRTAFLRRKFKKKTPNTLIAITSNRALPVWPRSSLNTTLRRTTNSFTT